MLTIAKDLVVPWAENDIVGMAAETLARHSGLAQFLMVGGRNIKRPINVGA